jgi:uncharacterized protein (DUF58 family)
MFFLALIIIVLAIYIVNQISIENALKGIEYTQKFSFSIVDPDEEFDIICILKNRTRRFVSYLRLREHFSIEIEPLVQSTKEMDYTVVESSHFMMPRQKYERRIRVAIPRRGIHSLYGASIYGGDFLGTNEVKGEFNCREEIVVIPRETELPNIEIKLSGYIGDVSVNRFIFEDPVLTVGFNNYTGQEPQRMISWTQTARVGQLMVKRYDYTVELMMTVLLNVDYSGNNYGDTVEECFSIARSVCQILEYRNIKYRLITNAITIGLRSYFDNLEYGYGKNHLMNILEGLGRAGYTVKESYEQMLDRSMDFAEMGVGHILITPKLDENHINSRKNFSRAKDKLKELTGFDLCILSPELEGEE